MQNRHGENIAPEAVEVITRIQSMMEELSDLPSHTQANREAIADALAHLDSCIQCLQDVEPYDHAIII